MMHLTTRTSSTRRLLMGVAVAGLLGLTACGSSAKDAAGSSATTVAAASDTTAKGAEGGATTAAKASDTTAAKSSGSGGDLADSMVAAFKAVEKGDCGKAKSIGDDINVAASANAASEIGNVGKAMEKLASSGPSELRADFAVMATAFTTMAKAYEELGMGDPTKMAEAMKDPAKAAKFTELTTMMDGDGFTKASENISAWMNKKCPGLDNG